MATWTGYVGAGAILVASTFAVTECARAAPSDGADRPVATGRDAEPNAVYVFGKRLEGVGSSVAASEGAVSFAKFEDRPLLRPGELVEVVPGMAATQHSGAAKANQYFLRGFNLDHGTDFSVRFSTACR